MGDKVPAFSAVKTDEHKDEHSHPLPKLSTRFIAHVNAPENVGRLAEPDGQAKGIGTCGDSMEIFLTVRDNRIKEIKHTPNGCAFTVACASAVTKLAKGHALKDCLKLTPEDVADELGGLPDDHRHCAVLAVNTLGEALEDYYQQVWGHRREGEGHGG